MKTPNFLTFLVTFTLLFSSCSTNETLLSEEQSSDLLDTYKIGRDEHGAYFLDYSIKENTQTETVWIQVQIRKIFICILQTTIQVKENLLKI